MNSAEFQVAGYVGFTRWRRLPASLSSRRVSSSRLYGLLAAVLVACWTGDAVAQSSFFTRLDTNKNGYIDVSEVDDRSRSYLQRYADAGGLRMTRSNSLSRWQAAYEKYRENRNKTKYVEVDENAGGVVGFGIDESQPMVPGFGAAKIEYPYNQADLDTADSILRRYDTNKDGFLDRAESQKPKWASTNPFDFDFNNDNRVSLLEFAQRFAHRRITAAKSNSSARGEYTSSTPTSSRSESSRSGSTSTRGSDRGSRYLAISVMGRYDDNRDGKLDARELVSAGVDAGKADTSRDGMIDRDELDQWLFAEMEAQANDLSAVLPSWFFEKDVNGDSQVEMAEFTIEWDEDLVAEFASFDVNEDGIITTDEAMTASGPAGGKYANHTATVMLPKTTVVSEIEVQEDVIIADLNVQLSITYTYDEHLDGYLTGPDGQRIELFTAVGRNDDHFDGTIFDDETSNSILRGRPPFSGSFQPEALAKRQPSLNHFKGKSLKGLWQLMIRTSRADRSGVLHGWSLIVTEAEPDPEAEQDGE